jgi:hypothetical protein
MRKLFTVGMAAVLCLAIAASPAAAKKHSAADFPFIATLDCGHGGPMVVGAGVDTADPFVDLKTGKNYLPLEWHVRIGDMAFDEIIERSVKGHPMTCSYDDGEAVGEVVVVKATGKKK